MNAPSSLLVDRPPRRGVLTWGFAGCLAIGLTIVTASMLDTRVWWLEIAAQFRWHAFLAFAAAATLVLGVRSLRMWRPIVAIAGVGLLITGADVLRVASNASTTARGGGTPVRVLHFNLGTRAGDWANVLAWVAAQPADVVFLQEARPDFAAALDASPLASKVVLRNVRPDSRGTIALVTGNATLVSARLDTDLFCDTLRELAEVTVDVGTARSTLLSVHMCRPTNATEFAKQSYELDRLGALLRASPSTIAIGDINCTLYSPRFRKALAGCRAANVGTWPTPLPASLDIATDALITGRPNAIERAEAGPHLGSDHRPLLATIRLPS